jgi:hypothetical protein
MHPDKAGQKRVRACSKRRADRSNRRNGWETQWTEKGNPERVDSSTTRE